MKTLLFMSPLALCATTLMADVPAATKPVPVSGGVVTLEPSNSQVNFIGTHEGPKPDPRKGGFAQFSGKARVDSTGALESVELEIKTASLWTLIPKLTNHLKSPDFFDVRQFPTARFRSTAIQPGADSTATVTGEFTLLGKTRSVEFPATVLASGKGVTLVSTFVIDRTDYGMNYGQGRVKKNVEVSVVIGEPTKVGE